MQANASRHSAKTAASVTKTTHRGRHGVWVGRPGKEIGNYTELHLLARSILIYIPRGAQRIKGLKHVQHHKMLDLLIPINFSTLTFPLGPTRFTLLHPL